MSDKYEFYFEKIKQLFDKYTEQYNLEFKTTFADVKYDLDEDGNALFTFNLKVKKSDKFEKNVQHPKIFYVAVPIIKSFDGKCIENGSNPQRIEILNVECISNEVFLDDEKPFKKETNISTDYDFGSKGTNLNLQLIAIPLKIISEDDFESFEIKITYQHENFAIKKSSLLNFLMQKRDFKLLWYFAFVTASKPDNKTARIEISHPTRGHLEIEPTEDRIKTEKSIGYTKHGKRFICGLHTNESGKAFMRCFFEYSYMPEWAVILISVIPYSLLLAIISIFYQKSDRGSAITNFFRNFPDNGLYKLLQLFNPDAYLFDLIFIFLISLLFIICLIKSLKRNCS